jgi:peptide/nickel transport system ATP-binding protein
LPRLGSSLNGKATRLAEIRGVVPSLKQRMAGCVFANRCAFAQDICRRIAPAVELKAPGHLAACHFAPKAG